MTSGAELAHGERVPVRQQSTSGIVSLVLGILGFVALPLIGSVLALVFGYQSRNEVRQRPDLFLDDYGRIGRILGWIGVALSTIALVLVALVVAFLFVVPA